MALKVTLVLYVTLCACLLVSGLPLLSDVTQAEDVVGDLHIRHLSKVMDELRFQTELTEEFQELFLNELKAIVRLAGLPQPGTQSSVGVNWHCVGCKIVMHIVRLAYDLHLSHHVLEWIAIHACEHFHIEHDHVCVGLTNMFAYEVFYVVEHLHVDPDAICGILLGPRCAGKSWPVHQWNITLPKVPKPPVKPHVLPKTGSPTLRVLHLTDIHMDNLYTPGMSAECGEPLCCRSYNGHPQSKSDAAGRYGDYRSCDTPIWTLKDLFKHLSTASFDYIMWTGDLPAHNIWNQTRGDQTELLYQLSDLLHEYFPGKPVYPSVGNHESSPVNSFPPRDLIKGNKSIAWLYNALADTWKSWLPPEALETVRRGGYYTFSPYPGFRIVSLNTNVCNDENWWLYLDYVDPDGQLAWLIQTLQKAEDNNEKCTVALLMKTLRKAEDNKEKVHILGHIPPGFEDCMQHWSYNYYTIVDRYESTITGQFYGHTHFDHFEVFYDMASKTRATNVAYITPSVTTFSHLNMGYRIFTVDGNYPKSSWAVLNHETYILDIEKVNNSPHPPAWELEYTAKEDLNMTSLFPEDWDNVIRRAEKDDRLFEKLYRFYTKSKV